MATGLDHIALKASPGSARRAADKGFHGRPETQTAAKKLPWPVVLFLIGLIVPCIIPLGSVNMPAYRMVLSVALVPCLFAWIGGKAGRIRPTEIGLILFCLWSGVSLVVAHGVAGAAKPTGVLTVETAGAYLMARCYIRDGDDFRNLILFMAKLIIFLAPFAVYEWLTSTKPLLAIFSAMFPTVDPTTMPPRWGFWRVQGPFSHSIVFGLVCGSILALTYIVLGRDKSAAFRWLLTATVGGTAFLSLSSAPISALAIQIALIGWALVLKDFPGKWKILAGVALAGYLVVEFGSNQTPIQFYISHFTFDQQTGWYRIWIWEHGSASVFIHPLFGIGFADWQRPAWMVSDSIDNFWLVTAMRHGLPALFLMLGSCLWATAAIGLKKGLDEKLAAYRMAYLICMGTYLVVGTTVHFWGAPYAWFLFLLGSGVWLLDVDAGEHTRTLVLNERNRGSTPNLPSGRQKAVALSRPHRYAPTRARRA